ncbi:actin [Gregarina niphandrodes]|uniref:Actin n=1 Tax=Gregarina niphandrodes TaxID=110365 RepID=A0A023B0X8_GRENI|nr:actin [Gregarina niphandrodes]EZG46121.1 actin [Gregarina niphandrodes]|eukprot:XP_011132377.1 actin [Gregarina niphandrodes]
MTIVLDINTRFSDVGLAGEASPSIIPSFIGYPVSPAGLDVKEIGFVPLESERKLDHVDALPVLDFAASGLGGGGDKLRYNQDALAVLCRYVTEQHVGERELLLVCPSLCGPEFRSAVAEVLFETHGLERILPQRSSVAAAFGCGRVSAVVPDLSCQYVQVSTVQEGHVQSEAHEVTRDAYVSIEQVPLAFPYDAKTNPFVSQSFLEFAKYYRVYLPALRRPPVESCVAPDGTHLQCTQAHPEVDAAGLAGVVERLAGEVTRRVTNFDVLSAVVLGGEVPHLLQFDQLTSDMHVGGLPYIQKAAGGTVGRGWRFLSHDRSAWFGGSILGSLSIYAQTAVDRSQWNEHGTSIWEKSGLC